MSYAVGDKPGETIMRDAHNGYTLEKEYHNMQQQLRSQSKHQLDKNKRID